MNIVRALGAGVTMGSLEDKFTSVKFFSDMSFYRKHTVKPPALESNK